jgi:SagB-type dehydrogenase family enzyme
MAEHSLENAARRVRAYHAASSHQLGRSAPGPGFLDWANQPEPFREYGGAPRLELPLAGVEATASWRQIHQPGAVAPRALDPRSLGAFFDLTLGITAWKEAGGERWALRANPSSGNLHPTEGYAILAERHGLPAGLHHYLGRDHVLERRFAPSLAEVLGRDAFLFGLTSLYWREAWKYGIRAFRYCQHDAGHALAAARYAAGVLGWTARLLERPGDDDLAALLGLDREDAHGELPASDREQPEVLVVVARPDTVDERTGDVEGALERLIAAARDGIWMGRPNALSIEHVRWEAIDEVAQATRRPRSSPSADGVGGPTGTGEERAAPPAGGRPALGAEGRRPTEAFAQRDAVALAVSLIRQRRSAVEMDGATGIEVGTFFHMLARLLPRSGVPPWDLWPWRPRVDPVFFVHRLRGLAAGVYLLARDPEGQPALRAALRPSFAWSHPPECPPELPLFLLEAGDARSAARFASCQQSIAADSAFAVAMLARMEPLLSDQPWSYRRLHWEAGLLGQVLYLEAEAAGVRGTGIGCFFDDVVHELLGIADGGVRDLYHFTVGGPLEDGRLTTLPAYDEAVSLR